MEPVERISTRDELKEWRRRLGLTQVGLARLLGVSRNAVARWEWGRHPIPPWLHLALAGIEATGAHLRLRGEGIRRRGG
jgi:DNA-binding transcriptional regulator YiaG